MSDPEFGTWVDSRGRPLKRKKINWDLVPLGTKFDIEIANELGVSYARVQFNRDKRGIPPFLKKEGKVLHRRTPTEPRFWERIQTTDRGCWEFTGKCDCHGYGTIWVSEEQRIMFTHRYSWSLAHGEIPEGLDVLHKCDNPPCVNPDHLFLGTQSDNAKDMHQKGRRHVPTVEISQKISAAHNPLANLDPEKVMEIRRLSSQGESYRKIAAKFDVTKTTIRNIVLKRTWKLVTEDYFDGKER